MLEIRAGVYVGDYSAKTRDMLWDQVVSLIEMGDAIMAWSTMTEAGYDFRTCGRNRREPVDHDGMKVVRFLPQEEEPAETPYF